MRTDTEQSAGDGEQARGGAGGRSSTSDGYRVAYDEYRVKLYKVACRAAREQREQLRLDWEQRDRERD